MNRRRGTGRAKSNSPNPSAKPTKDGRSRKAHESKSHRCDGISVRTSSTISRSLYEGHTDRKADWLLRIKSEEHRLRHEPVAGQPSLSVYMLHREVTSQRPHSSTDRAEAGIFETTRFVQDNRFEFTLEHYTLYVCTRGQLRQIWLTREVSAASCRVRASTTKYTVTESAIQML